jgi:hypothetical protein
MMTLMRLVIGLGKVISKYVTACGKSIVMPLQDLMQEAQGLTW